MTARIITVANQKGGTGKTTAVAELSTLYARQGKRVLAIDADPQGTLSDWIALAESIDNEPAFDYARLDSLDDLDNVPGLAEDYDLILVDTPGHKEHIELVNAYLKITDFALLVTLRGAADRIPTHRYLDQLIIPQGTPAAVLINRMKTARKDDRDRLRTAVDDLKERGYTVMPTGITEDSEFMNCMEDGEFITAHTRPNAYIRSCARSYENLAADLLEMVNNS